MLLNGYHIIKEAKREPENDPVYYLREFSNYLAPKVGILSGDTWTLLAIYLRNLFLNWLVMVPVLALVLLIPVFALSVLKWKPDARFGSWCISPGSEWILVFGSVLLGVASIGYASVAPPSCSVQARRLRKWIVGRGDHVAFLANCLLPRVLAAILFALFWYWHAVGWFGMRSSWPVLRKIIRAV